MQNIRTLLTRLAAAFIVSSVCLSLIGCGGGREAALDRYKMELDQLNLHKKEYEDFSAKIQQGRRAAATRLELSGASANRSFDELSKAERELGDMASARIAEQQQRVDEAKAALDQFDEQ